MIMIRSRKKYKDKDIPDKEMKNMQASKKCWYYNWCEWCRRNRLYKYLLRHEIAKEKIREYLRNNEDTKKCTEQGHTDS